MSRYIDADKLQQVFKEIHEGKRSLLIDTEPTVDAVEVVRCDQCRHFEAINNDDHGWCKLVSDWPDEISARYDNDYCSYGERADE